MKQAIKDQWVKDLRSGEFVQGDSMLDYIGEDSKRKQCCLGVLCHQAVKAGAIPEPEEHGGRYLYLDVNPENPSLMEFDQESILPEAVRVWAGLDSVNPEVAPLINAADANDNYNYTFEEIADLIEQNVPVTE